VTSPQGKRHFAWAITWLEGRPLADAARRSPELLLDFGRQIAKLDAALADFDHPAIHRDFYWDLANGRSIVESSRALLDEEPLISALDRLIGEFDTRVAPVLADLPRAAIDNDLNDHNVLVGGGDDVEHSGQCVTGVVDFGDMVYGYRVGNLAIAIAYAVLGARDPLTVAGSIVRGYSTERADEP
jgi:Ser/Thr protein kinase RdoA (MazF antagonist)